MTLTTWTEINSLSQPDFIALIEYIEVMKADLKNLPEIKCEMTDFDSNEFLTEFRLVFQKTFFDSIYYLQNSSPLYYKNPATSDLYFYGSEQNMTILQAHPAPSIISCRECLYYNPDQTFFPIEIALDRKSTF